MEARAGHITAAISNTHAEPVYLSLGCVALSCVRGPDSLITQQLEQLADDEALVHEVRQCGMIAGIELRRSDGRAFDGNLRVGEMVSVMARDYQVLTRPIMDTLVVMPPLSISMDEIKTLCGGLASAIRDYRVTHDA